MIVKPSISWLTTDSDVLLINDVSAILLAMAGNPTIYPTPAPTLGAIQGALSTFATDLALAGGGGVAATIKKNNARLVLVSLMRQLASYVTVACKGDLMNLTLSGFPIQKPTRTPIGTLPAPQNLIVTHGALTGNLNAKVNPVFGASAYNWTCTANTPDAVPVTGQTTAASFTFAGLTPGVAYTVMSNAIGAAGPSNWSSPVSQIAV